MVFLWMFYDLWPLIQIIFYLWSLMSDDIMLIFDIKWNYFNLWPLMSSDFFKSLSSDVKWYVDLCPWMSNYIILTFDLWCQLILFQPLTSDIKWYYFNLGPNLLFRSVSKRRYINHVMHFDMMPVNKKLK